MERFESEVEAFHAQWVAHFEPLIYGNLRLIPEDLDGLPRWEFPEERGSEVRAAVFPGMLGLLLFAGVVLGIALRLLKNGGHRRWMP